MTHPLDEVIHFMCSGHLQRRPRDRSSLELARLKVEQMREQVKDYDIVIVWGKHA